MGDEGGPASLIAACDALGGDGETTLYIRANRLLALLNTARPKFHA